MNRLLVVAACLAGCDGIFDLEPVMLDRDGGNGSGDDIDAAVPCYGGNNGAFLEICLAPGVDDDWVGTSDIETSASASQCEQVIPHDGRDLCVIAARTINIGTAIDTRGSRPLVLVATDTMTISASVIASSTLGRRGPGSNPITCAPGNGQSGGGGAGGTHGSIGGTGGAANGVNGGMAQPVSTGPIVGLSGGCQGGNTASGNVGGDGGGALYLIAGTQITLVGATLDTSGERGRGGDPTEGGGGGGAGGMIVFDAPNITINQSIVVAIGGGGGGGGGTTAQGVDGMSRNLGLNDYAALGGLGGASGGGAGGGGADLDSPAVTGENAGDVAAGGGGGGGGHGRILVYGVSVTINASVLVPPRQP